MCSNGGRGQQMSGEPAKPDKLGPIRVPVDDQSTAQIAQLELN
jgi:hypothetical protein